MYHLIALYNNNYYYLGCVCNHLAAATLFDLYLKQFPNIKTLHTRFHPLRETLEYIKDFKTYDHFYETYQGDMERAIT